jgi:carbonic anhydrase
MTTFTTPQLQSKVKGEHPADAVVAKQVEGINFLEFSDLEISIREDVEFLKHNPLVLKETVTTGWTFDVETGKVGTFLIPYMFGGHR